MKGLHKEDPLPWRPDPVCKGDEEGKLTKRGNGKKEG